jgi:hypothetical protein
LLSPSLVTTVPSHLEHVFQKCGCVQETWEHQLEQLQHVDLRY